VSETAEKRPSVDVDGWAGRALALLTDLPGVVRTGVALTEGGGRQLLFTASDRSAVDGPDWCEVDGFEDVPLNNAVRTGKLIAGTPADLAARYPDFVARQAAEIRTLACIPLSADGQILGGVVLYYATQQPFDPRQLDALRGLADELARDLRRAQHGEPLLEGPLDAESVPEGARAAAYVVPAEPRGVGLAREFVHSTLQAWDVQPAVVDSAVLCVSELVTNAIIHTHAGCEVRVVLHDSVLTAAVRDAGTLVTPPSRTDEDPLAARGRGLQLVEALSARWGSELHARGMTVWCELRVA
jgi:anti-sigma regulatory factor (Ser/Thr protein kinase)